MQVFSSSGIYGWESHVYQWLVNYGWVHMLFMHANNDKLYNGKGSIILLLASIVYDISQSLHNLCHIGTAPYVIIPAWSIRWVRMHSNNNQHWHDYLRLNSEFQSLLKPGLWHSGCCGSHGSGSVYHFCWYHSYFFESSIKELCCVEAAKGCVIKCV